MLVSNITNDLFSNNLFLSISELSASDINTIIQYEDILVAYEIIDNKQSNGKSFHNRIIDVKQFLQGCVSKTVRLDLENQYIR